MNQINNANSQLNYDALVQLKKIDVQLAYLAILTCQGHKPLSRWEKPLTDKDLVLLNQLGLFVKRIPRSVKTKSRILETIFSLSLGYMTLYENRFADRPIDKSAAAIRFEGFLFGFPPCCVDQYIRHPYVKNGLDPNRQKILFHWACPDCQITKILLPQYEKVYNFLESL